MGVLSPCAEQVDRTVAVKTRFRDEASRRGFLAELQTWIDMPKHPHRRRVGRRTWKGAGHFASMSKAGRCAVDCRTKTDAIGPDSGRGNPSAWGFMPRMSWVSSTRHEARQRAHDDGRRGEVDGFRTGSGPGARRGGAVASARWDTVDQARAKRRRQRFGQRGWNDAALLLARAGRKAALDPENRCVELGRQRVGDVRGRSVLAVRPCRGAVARVVSGRWIHRRRTAATDILRQCWPEPDKRWATLQKPPGRPRRHRNSVGRVPRSTPAFSRASDRVSVEHDRQTTTE